MRSFAVLRTSQDDRCLILGARLMQADIARERYREVGDAFGVEMNFAVVVAAEAIKELSEGALRAVLPINERSDDR